MNAQRVPESAPRNTVAMNASLGGVAIRSVVRAISADETHKQLNSLLMEVGPARVTLVGTNGHWLAKSDVLHNTDSGAGWSMLVRLKDVEAIITMLRAVERGVEKNLRGQCVLQFERSGDECSVSVWLGEKELGRVLYGNVDATYPDYRNVIPKTRGASSMLCLSSAYLADICASIKDIVGAKGKNTTLIESCGDEYSPVVFSLLDKSHRVDWLAVVMQVRR